MYFRKSIYYHPPQISPIYLQVYGTHGKQSKETDKVNPKYDFEICKLNVEKDLASIEGLKYIILRLGIVYGIGDKYG